MSEPTQKEKKTIDIKKYMKEYRKEHPEKWTGIKICTECGVKYQINNAYAHKRSKKHKYGIIEKENEKLKEIKKIIINT